MVRKTIRQYELTYKGKYYGIGSIKELSELSGIPEKSLRSRETHCRKHNVPKSSQHYIAYVYTKGVPKPDAPARDTKHLLRNLIGDNVKRLMQEQQVDRKYLADAVGVSYNHIERLERGGVCSMGLLAKLIDFFQVEPLEMLENWTDRTVTDIEEEN